jgi:hypothetical protein
VYVSLAQPTDALPHIEVQAFDDVDLTAPWWQAEPLAELAPDLNAAASIARALQLLVRRASA